ncbi:MAG: PD-(D/E)XK nuclease family protein, partial [Mycobacteriaceae bacterium]
ATQRLQKPLTAETAARWRGQVLEAAAATRGPNYRAVVNDGCTHCPVQSACPAHESGRQVGSA